MSSHNLQLVLPGILRVHYRRPLRPSVTIGVNLIRDWSEISKLLPANEVWGKVIFSQASVILFTGGGDMCGTQACPLGTHATRHAPPRYVPPGMHSPGHAPPRHTPPQGYYKMRSMSGQYASYWNAFLLATMFIKVYKHFWSFFLINMVL